MPFREFGGFSRYERFDYMRNRGTGKGLAHRQRLGRIANRIDEARAAGTSGPTIHLGGETSSPLALPAPTETPKYDSAAISKRAKARHKLNVSKRGSSNRRAILMGSSVTDPSPTLRQKFTRQFKKEFNSGTKKAKVGRAAGKAMGWLGRRGVGLGKLGVKAYRATPKTFKVGGAIVGAAAMLGISMLKGAMDQSQEIVYERYMQDAATSKNMLNNTRLGLASGTSRMQNYGSTMGLTNALSRTRHGRY